MKIRVDKRLNLNDNAFIRRSKESREFFRFIDRDN